MLIIELNRHVKFFEKKIQEILGNIGEGHTFTLNNDRCFPEILVRHCV